MSEKQIKKSNTGAASIKAIKRRQCVFRILSYVVLTFFALLILLPFLIAVITSVTPEITLVENGFQWFTGILDLGYYRTVLFTDNYGNIFRAIGNTLLYIVPQLFVGMFCSCLAAYAFARMRFRGKNLLFYLMLCTMVIPGIIITFPSYLLFTQVYKVGQWFPQFPIIVPGMFGAVGTMFFLKQYFSTLPRELEEAATIDGMGRFGIFRKIILPLSTPAIITQLLLGFNGAYNDYLVPLLYVGGSPKYYTVQLFVYGLSTNLNKSYPLLMAGGLVAILPVLIVYLAGQKYFVEGIVMTGIK